MTNEAVKSIKKTRQTLKLEQEAKKQSQKVNKLRVGFFARRDFLLASNHKKKASHRTISENGNRTASYPMADFAHFSTQNHAIKNSIVSKYSP
jgi:hypothetical protein